MYITRDEIGWENALINFNFTSHFTKMEPKLAKLVVEHEKKVGVLRCWKHNIWIGNMSNNGWKLMIEIGNSKPCNHFIHSTQRN